MNLDNLHDAPGKRGACFVLTKLKIKKNVIRGRSYSLIT